MGKRATVYKDCGKRGSQLSKRTERGKTRVNLLNPWGLYRSVQNLLLLVLSPPATHYSQVALNQNV